ncbi:MAG: endonuclease/exonuclease/phosphatase family protein [Ardenticatenales bacterium]|nr:endonuclease/exonuclease/phosphatase family protein [Ardenticatenales bacterium]
MTLRLLSYNIRFGGRGREAALAQVIRTVEPDIVLFQEATDPKVIEGLAEATEMPHWGAQRASSTGFISRRTVASHQWHHPRGSKHSFLEVHLERSNIHLFDLHLSSQFSKWSERQRAREIRALLEAIKDHKEGFHVLVGDFNTLAPGELLEVWRMPTWIQALIWISGREIQRETIQVVLDAGYTDGYRHLHPQGGFTFPVWNPHLRLDYLFLPAAFADCLKECQVIQEPEAVRLASDHYPLLALLDVKIEELEKAL